MPTPHNEAQKGDIAKVVLMPGDPRRAAWIAENFLHDAKLVNTVRGMLCFTGYTKNNCRISVMAHGMGNPSVGIYSHELFTEYDVDVIIRVGTCGSYQPYIKVRDIIFAQGACTDSNWMSQYELNGTYSAIASFDVLEKAVSVVREKGLGFHVGNVFAADVFYDVDSTLWKKWAKLNVLAVEMESYALYVNAAYLGKKALTILTATDNFVTGERLSIQERQAGLNDMMAVAIATAEKLA